MKVEISSSTAEEIVVQELKWHYEIGLKPNNTIPHFSHDPEEEQRKLNKLRKAFKRVLDYYGCKVE